MPLSSLCDRLSSALSTSQRSLPIISSMPQYPSGLSTPTANFSACTSSACTSSDLRSACRERSLPSFSSHLASTSCRSASSSTWKHPRVPQKCESKHDLRTTCWMHDFRAYLWVHASIYVLNNQAHGARPAKSPMPRTKLLFTWNRIRTWASRLALALSLLNLAAVAPSCSSSRFCKTAHKWMKSSKNKISVQFS